MRAHVCRYRYQLEAFIDKLRGRDPEHWFDAEDSITNMEWIEAIYKEVSHIVMLFVSIAFHLVSTPRRGRSRGPLTLAY
jgi:hypothetical protein